MSRYRLTHKGTTTPIPDTVPDAFTFTDITNAALSTTETSNTITVAGLGSAISVAVTVSGGTFQKNGGAFGSSASTAVNGDTFAVQHTSSASNSTPVNTTLTIGGVSDTYTSTTLSSGTTVTYDTRFGTDATTAAATGWFTFGLHSGNRRVWLDSVNGNDANNGLTAAAAVATPTRAWTVFTTGWTSGDQIMVAGGAAQTYTDPNTLGLNWRNYPGISATYPTAFLCYDSTDATNSAKYGKLLGSAKPKWLFTATGQSTIFELPGDNSNFSHNYATQGLDFSTQGLPDVVMDIVGRHDNLCFQNCRSDGFAFSFDGVATSFGPSQNLNISKCSAWNMWSAVNGNNSFIFSAGMQHMWAQDIVIGHSGWPIGASRDDGISNGGPTFLGHSVYYHAGANAARFDRIFYADGECDNWGIRGDATATQLFSLDTASGEALSGFSGDFSEQPEGATITLDDFVICGAARELNSAIQNDGGGIGFANAKDVRVNNGAFFDNPFTDSHLFTLTTSSSGPGQVNQSVTISNIKTHNYAPNMSMFYQPQSTNVGSWTFTNCLLDTLTGLQFPSTPLTVSGTGVRTWVSADYANPSFNRAALYSALGFSSKAALINAMLAFPHLPWTQASLALSFAAFSVTPVYATASVPSLAGLPTPEIVYKTTLGNLTLDSSYCSTFVRHSNPAISSITRSGTVATVTTASAHGVSTGMGVCITGTAQTPNDSSTFDTQGVAKITVTGSTTFTYVPQNTPSHTSASTVGSYKQAILLTGSGANSTFSATGLEAGMALTGRMITYDGTGAGAFSTISVAETNGDGAGTHTTTGLVIG